LPAGQAQTLSATFTPASSVGYPYPVTQTATINVNPAPLTITANSLGMAAGSPVPPLTASYTGFVNGDTAASLTTPPALLTTATSASPPNTTYPINVSSVVDPNYTINYVSGTLVVGPATWTTPVAATAPPGQTVTVSVPPGSSQGGVTASLNNGSGTASGTVAAAVYAGDPVLGQPGDRTFALGASYLDLEAPGASASDTLTAYFYYPPGISPAPTLFYWTGSGWSHVLSNGATPPGIPPALNPTPDLDNTVSGGQYTVVFGANSTPPITALNGTIMALADLNPPLAAPMTVTRIAGATVLIALSDLATNWSDPYGYPVSLIGVNLTSTNGQHVYPLNLTTNRDGSYVIANTAFLGYLNPANVNDQISYTISDGQGDTNESVINLVVSTSPQFGQTTGIVNPGGQAVTLHFAGQPGYSYSVQRSTNLTTWVTIWTTNAPPAGPFQYTDTFSDLGGQIPPAAYYRLTWNP
jgi:hypothetical protein